MKRRGNRIVSFIITIGLIVTTSWNIASCSFKKDVAGIAFGQWLVLLNESFGMNTYLSDEPYFDDVGKENPYFEVVQVASEWDVLVDEEDLDVDKALTYKQALVTLVNAGRFMSLESDADSKAKYGIKIFNNEIRDYWMDREIDVQEAAELLSTAQQQWAIKSFTENKEDVKLAENVVDLTGENSVLENYVEEGDTITISDCPDLNLKEGDIYVVPDKEHPFKANSYKVESIQNVDGAWVIKNSDEELSLEDIAEEVQIQETIVANDRNMILYDADGNVVASSDTVSRLAAQGGYEAGYLGKNAGGRANTPVVSASLEKTIKLKNDWKFTYKLSTGGGVNVGVGAKLEHEEEKSKRSSSVGIDYKIKNLQVTNEMDYSFFTLHSASTKLDYDTEMVISGSFGRKFVDGVYAPYNNPNGKSGFDGLFDAVWKDSDLGKGAKTIKFKQLENIEIKIGSIEVWSAGVVCVCLDITFNIKLDGTLSVKVTTKNSKGVEYYKNNLRFINVDDKNIDASFQTRIE